MAQYGGSPPDPGSGAFTAGAFARNGATKRTIPSKPAYQQSKSVSYNATESDVILNVKSAITTQGDNKIITPSRIEVVNTGGVPLMIMAGYSTYAAAGTGGSSATADLRYLHAMIMPGEVFTPPARAVITSDLATDILAGTVLSNQVPNSNMYTDSGENCTGLANTTDPVTFATSGPMFRVADLIRVENEIMEITAISGGDVTVKRGLFGSDPASHSDASDVRFAFFNTHHDSDRYSVAQTDDDGKFACSNFFGVGRAASGNQGILPGSVAFKFYQAGYQEVGLSGISSTTNTGLTAGGSYWLKIAIDGGTAESINFTVDSSNTNFGGNNGVLTKIQQQLDEKYYNTAANIFEQSATVDIVNGDVRFTSGSHLSTSAIALTAGADGASAAYNIFAQQNGRFPAIGTSAGNPRVPDAVAARLPDDVVYDRLTHLTSPNTAAFGYDDGLGGLFGMCKGTIDYETGAIDMRGCPKNAEFVYSVSHSGAFSGKINEAETARANSLEEILANTTSLKWDGGCEVRVY